MSTCWFCDRRFTQNIPSNISRNERAFRWHKKELFCSPRCKAWYQNGWRKSKCGNCSCIFPGFRLKTSPPVFCSIGCRAVYSLRIIRIDKEYWKTLRTGSDWRHIRQDIRSRDSYTCQVCGWSANAKVERRSLHVDHIVPFELCKVNDERNLLLICDRCHKKKTGDAYSLWRTSNFREGFDLKLIRGNIPGFLQALRNEGWPMKTVKKALSLYGLPSRKFKWGAEVPIQ
jgi:hypothetical protein